MIENLDIRTLSFTTVLLCHVFGIGLMVFNKNQRDFNGIYLAGVGILTLGYGFLLMSFRGIIDISLSIVAANILIFLGVVLISEGFFKFKDYKGKLKSVGPTLLIILSALFIYYTYFNVNINTRIVVISYFLSIQFSVCAFVILNKIPESAKSPYVMTGFTMITAALFFIFRAVWASEESGLKNFMSAGVVHSLAFIAIELVVITLSFGLVWIVNSLLKKQLMDLSCIDPLTNILNRRGLEEIILKITAQMNREKKPLTAVMIDIDHFKSINDTYGHQAGDFMLKEFSALIQKKIRSSDILARYGGEEFIIALPNTNEKGALHITEKLRRRIEKHDFKIPDGSVKITASFGFFVCQDTIVWEKLVSKSDKALYKAKSNGRNRVEAFCEHKDCNNEGESEHFTTQLLFK